MKRPAPERLTQLAVNTFVVCAVLVGVLFTLALLESTGGHDGWLCEWGIDTGPTSSGCG